MRRSQVSAAERERIVKGFEGSESSLSDYCTAHNVTIDQYYKWRRTLFGPTYKRRKKRGGFIELGTQAVAVNRADVPLHLEIEIAGIVIRVRK